MPRSPRLLTAISATLLAQACATPGDRPAPNGGGVAPATPALLIGDILGAEPDDLDALLGAPALTRKEGAGEYRRYGLAGCSLVVILYPDDNGEPRAAHVEATAKTSDTEKPDLNECLAAG